MKIMLAAAAAIMAAVPGNATVITDTFSLTSTFSSGPFTAISGDFSITFDNSADISAATSGLVVKNSILSGFNPTYSYSISSDRLIIATVGNYFSCSVKSGLNQFCFTVFNASTAPTTGTYFTYSTSGSAGSYSATTVFASNSTAIAATTAVPEPAAWAMMTAGFGLLGSTIRRRRGQAFAAA